MVRNLKKQSWSIHFGCVKAHAGIDANEATDTLAKEASEDEDRNFLYDGMPTPTTVAV